MKTSISIIFILALIFSSCTPSSESEQSNTVSQESILLPEFKIEKQNLNEAVKKASFDIRLGKKASEGNLELIAHNIKAEHPGFERYFIAYYLPDMEIGTGAWATSHFNPDLKVEVLGLSEEEEEKLASNPTPDGEVIGRWLDERPYVGNRITIYKQGAAYKLGRVYSDGSSSDMDLEKTGDKFIYENDFGQYFKIEADKTLGIYDKDGKITSANQVE